MKGLIVAETFYSIQGEGQTMGYPSVFLRLAGCNLLCQGKGWVCDTIEVWKHGIKKNYEDVLPLDLILKLKQGAHLVITGGEPLLQQKQIVEFLHIFFAWHAFLPVVEIETNGTIVPEWELKMLVHYWNVSPKLSNSGEDILKRYNSDAIKFFNSQSNAIFKFVVASKEDVNELILDYATEIDFKKVILMPAGSSQKELELSRQTIAEESVRLGVRYCDRLHIVIWNKKTGV